MDVWCVRAVRKNLESGVWNLIPGDQVSVVLSDVFFELEQSGVICLNRHMDIQGL